MAGQIKKMIDKIIWERAKGNEAVIKTTKSKLMLKGVNVSKYTADSPDDDKIVAKLKSVAVELGVTL